VASIHAQENRAGNAYRVLWRHDGRQRSLSFDNLPAAERFKTLLEDHGPDEALRIIELDEIGRHVPTVAEWLCTYIDNLTGVQPATIRRLAPANDVGISVSNRLNADVVTRLSQVLLNWEN
jgi:integrase